MPIRLRFTLSDANSQLTQNPHSMNQNHIYQITRKGDSFSRYLRITDASGPAHADATVQDYIRTNLPGRCWDYSVKVLLIYNGDMDSLRAMDMPR